MLVQTLLTVALRLPSDLDDASRWFAKMVRRFFAQQLYPTYQVADFSQLITYANHWKKKAEFQPLTPTPPNQTNGTAMKLKDPVISTNKKPPSLLDATFVGRGFPSPKTKLPTIPPRYRVLQSERRWWHNTPRSNPPGCYGDSTPCWRYHLHAKFDRKSWWFESCWWMILKVWRWIWKLEIYKSLRTW